MTTIYIEEVTDDEVSSNIDDNDTDVTIHHPSKQSSFNSNLSPFRIEHLSPCPCPIGGGSSITSIGKKAFVFGGCDRTGVPSNGLHSYDFETNKWECNLDCRGRSPSPRFGHSAIAFESKLYIFGGQGISNENDTGGTSSNSSTTHNPDDSTQLESFSSLCYLDVETMTWGEVDSSAQEFWPKRRNSHDSALLSTKLVVFGGANEVDGPMNDLWTYDFHTKLWRELHAVEDHVPCVREMHTLSGDPEKNRVYLLGGRMEDGTICRDLFVYNFDDNTWTELEAPTSPRCAHGSALTQSRHLDTFGGWDGMGTIFNDCISYDTETNAWTTIENVEERESNQSVPRFAHCIASISTDKILLAGGVNASHDLCDTVVIQRTHG